MTPEEQIADALTRLATIAEKWFEKQYAPKRNPLDVRDALVTAIPTPEERLRTDQGATGEATTEEWIGNREQKAIEEERARNSAAKPPAIQTGKEKKRRAPKDQGQQV